MSRGELRPEDADIFPYLSTSDLSAPRVSPPKPEKALIDDDLDQILAEAKKENTRVRNAADNKGPKKIDQEIEELTRKAIDARNMYAEANAVFRRAPPQGRGSLVVLRADGEKRIERAARIYTQRRDDLKRAYGGVIPVDVESKLWTYDDAEEKKRRDAWMNF